MLLGSSCVMNYGFIWSLIEMKSSKFDQKFLCVLFLWLGKCGPDGLGGR